MREVSGDTASLLVDAVERRGLDPHDLWKGLGVPIDALKTPGVRIDWVTWCRMMATAEDAIGGPASTADLFVPGAGARTGHVFVRLAPAFLSLEHLYALFVRWGLTRTLMCDGAVHRARDGHLEVTVRFPFHREGSAPTLRFIVGILRNLPGLQERPPARVEVRTMSPHEAVYDVQLPPERSLLVRLGRMWSFAQGATAALDELSAQSEEIAEQNRQLTAQLAALEQTTETLRQREQWLALALEAGRMGVWQWEPDEGRVRWSPGGARVVGLGEDAGDQDLATWAAAVHADDRPRFLAAVHDLRDSGTLDLEYRVIRNGRTAWVRSRGRRVAGPPGATRVALGTVIDLSEQKELEERLRFADRLISAGTLAAGVAHEINNPLGAVIGNIQLLRGDLRPTPGFDDRIRQRLDDVETGLVRIRDVVRDLRTFSRPEQETTGPLDLRAVCESALRLVGPVVRNHARIDTAWDPGPLFVDANESRLAQVVVNLVVNAGQAIADGAAAPVVRVSTHRRVDEVELRVADNGTGIPPEVLPRLFEPFFTTKPAHTGTGLGLPICQRIVTALGGRIEVESTLGEGSVFHVWLPLAVGEPTTPPVPSAPAAPVAQGQRRILVVDDEPMIRRLLEQVLVRRGFRVVTAGGGGEALALVAGAGDDPFDVVVCDLMMPGVTGADVRAHLASTDPGLAARMVFLTGGAVTERTHGLLESPDTLVVHKPFDPSELVSRILEAAARAGT